MPSEMSSNKSKGSERDSGFGVDEEDGGNEEEARMLTISVFFDDAVQI